MKELAKSNPQDFSVQATNYSQNVNIEVLGNIANRQAYDAATGEFEPNYETRPCQLFPRCFLIDPDTPTATETFNSRLNSLQWCEVTSSGEKVVFPVDSNGGVLDGYDVDKDGIYKGMLYVKSNGKVGTRRTMKFIGIWKDPLSGYVYRFEDTKPLGVEDATTARPEIALDSPASCPWNPLRQTSAQTITATVVCGKKVVTEDAKCKIWWVRVLDDGSKEAITDGDTDGSIEIASITKGKNGQITSITIDRNLIGDSISYEAYAVYKAEGTLPASYKDTDARATTTITRLIPALTASYLGATTRVASGVHQVQCTAMVSDNQGAIPEDTWKELIKCKWEFITKTINTKGEATENATLIGYGNRIWVPVEQYKFLRLTLIDRENYLAIVDDNGNYLIDDDGNILIERALIN